MHPTTFALTLPTAQTRMINASEGFRLEVLGGCLWLTRPGDSVDRFLVAGSSIELFENQVLIQSDRHPGAPGLEAACYRLTPLLRNRYQRTQTQMNSAGRLKKGSRPMENVLAVHACWAMAVRESWNPEI